MKKVFKKDEINNLAKEILDFASKQAKSDTATLITLSGDLGAGKTTLTQSLAKELGVKDTVISPTFVLMKKYETKNVTHKNLVHIDAYRFDSHQELEKLGWAEIISDKENLVLLEWPEKVPKAIPNHAISIKLSHINEEEREIDF